MNLAPRLCAAVVALAALVLSANAVATSGEIDQKHPANAKKAPGAKKAAGTKGHKQGVKQQTPAGDISTQNENAVQQSMQTKSQFESSTSNLVKKESKASNGVTQNMKH